MLAKQANVSYVRPSTQDAYLASQAIKTTSALPVLLNSTIPRKTYATSATKNYYPARNAKIAQPAPNANPSSTSLRKEAAQSAHYPFLTVCNAMTQTLA